MAKDTSGGKRATRTGNKLERYVEQALLGEGYQKVKGDSVLIGKVFSRQRNIGRTIYDTPLKADFLVNSPTHPIVVECKWQQVGGSVDEKYLYLVANIQAIGIPTIVVVDGGGYKPGALAWLKRQVTGSLIGVYTMREFQQVVNDGDIF